ncbi:MAG: T9SS type A sorting domain-containing protein [Ignavibacteriae bacterium]|nr:T9SS type A sorting domain-containing protein [Ignavibacteriota bacterium]
MKNYLLIFVLFLCCVLPVNAQVTNLIVSGSDTNFTFVTGGAIGWQYNVSPNGATATVELWLDVNNNNSIDTAIDKNRFTFTQTDGVSNGNDGPGDDDGTQDGTVSFSQSSGIGIAPGKYVFRVTQGGASLSVKGTITHLSSPAHTVSGTVTPPSGKSAANIFMQIRPSGEGDDKPFWEAVTDGSGNFAIEMDADTTGNPWKLRLADNYNPFPGSVVSPAEYSFDMIGNPNGYTFSFGSAAAKVVGYVRDDDGNFLTNYNVWMNRNNSSFNANVNTNGSGYFEIGLSAGDLSNDDFTLGTNFNSNEPTHTHLAASVTINGIQSTDSLYYTLVPYKVNSTIQGQVRVNGNPPGFPIEISGSIQDSAWTATWADSTTGNFSLEVSNKLYNYNLYANNLPNNYFVNGVTAHPGETGVIINITVTEVSERESGIPLSYSLGQNYPNPFNPTTSIDYDITNAGYVQLSLYNILGEEVLNVVNQEQSAGKYRATIDASSLSSGMYFYKLQAGQFSSTKKMILMK